MDLAMVEPTTYVRPAPPPPTGHWLQRGLTALFREHRLPYRMSIAFDRFCNAVGLPRKTLKVNGFTVQVRRLTCDEQFVENIIVNEEYTRQPFTIRESDVIIDIGGNIGTFALLSTALRPGRQSLHDRTEQRELRPSHAQYPTEQPQ